MPSRRPRPVIQRTLLVFVGAALAAFGAERRYAASQMAALRESVRNELQAHAARVAYVFGRHITRTLALQAFVEAARDVPSLTRDFAPFGQGLLANVSAVRAIEIVRGARITMVYPKSGNERALNVDFLKHSNLALRHAYQRALTNPSVTIVGPLRLVQGTDGLIFFLPVRAAYDPTIELVEMVVDLPGLIAQADLTGPPEGLALALSDRQGRTIGGTRQSPDVDPVVVAASGFDGNWPLRGSPIDGWDETLGARLLPIRAALALIVVLCTLLAFTYARLPTRAVPPEASRE